MTQACWTLCFSTSVFEHVSTDAFCMILNHVSEVYAVAFGASALMSETKAFQSPSSDLRVVLCPKRCPVVPGLSSSLLSPSQRTSGAPKKRRPWLGHLFTNSAPKSHFRTFFVKHLFLELFYVLSCSIWVYSRIAAIQSKQLLATALSFACQGGGGCRVALRRGG